MDALETAVQWAVGIAEDETHGYDQENRWGPDYDCSSLVISAFDHVGINVIANGASYTGNMKNAFLKSGFIDVLSSINLTTGSGLFRGDVLLRETGHTAIYLGNGKLVNAQWNENGKKTGGVTGDQTGKEICTRSYYNSPPAWSSVLRLITAVDIPAPDPENPPVYGGPVTGYTPPKSTGGMLKVMKRYYVGG